jgi:multiple sugar transport system substrate-binding protein
MPGETHSTLGFAKSYVVTSSAAADPARAEAAWKLVNFMAGKPYTVAKRWAVEKGLGFGQLPLFQDQEVISAWSKWADVAALAQQASIARAGTYTEFSSVWSAYFRPLLAQAMVGEASVDEVMKAGAQRWNELKERFANR